MTASDLLGRVEEFKRNFEKPVQGADKSAATQFSEAVQQRLDSHSPRAGFIASAPSASSNDSSGEQLSKAVKERLANMGYGRRKSIGGGAVHLRKT